MREAQSANGNDRSSIHKMTRLRKRGFVTMFTEARDQTLP